MGDHYYFFPEKPETNPSSFLCGAESIDGPFAMEGYKLYSFVDCIDTVDFPFWAAPVPSPTKKVSFYRFKFHDSPPNYEKHGLKIQHTEKGDIIYLPQQQFMLMSVKYRSISVKSGHWPDVCNAFHKLVAYYHLDVIPRITKEQFKNPFQIAEIDQRFHQLYDMSDTVSSSLRDIFFETMVLLRFFCFPLPNFDLPKNIINEDTDFYFGSLKGSLDEFSAKCFPDNLIGDCCLTPAILKQLRALMRFVRIAISKITSDPGDDIHNILSRLNKFQRHNNLPEGYCDSITLKLLWQNILAKSPDLITALSQSKVSLNIDLEREYDKFGEISGKNLSLPGQKIAIGFSKAISDVPSPSSAIAKVQKTVLKTTQNAIKEFQEVGNGISNLQEKLKYVTNFANDVNNEAIKASEKAEMSIRIVDGLDQKNAEVSEKVILVKQNVEKEVAKTNLLTTLFLFLIIIAILQWLERRKSVHISTE